MSQTNATTTAATTAVAASTTLQQQLQLHAAAATPTTTMPESLLSNAFDLIGGTTAAQQLLNHIDLYAATTRQQQQQFDMQQQQQLQHIGNNNSNNSYTQRQQQQQHSFTSTPSSNSHASSTTPPSSSSLSCTSLSSASSGMSSTSSSPSQLGFNTIINHHQSSLALIAPNSAATISQQHSMPLISPTATFAYKSSHQQQQQHCFNLNSNQNQQHNHHQMDAGQQQQQQPSLQQQQSLELQLSTPQQQQQQSIANTIAAATTTTEATTVAASNAQSQHTQQQQQLQQQQQHQHAGNNSTTSPYKSCWCFGETSYHMKILVPAVASGAIIGKGGETIAALQKDTGARVKMSKSHDFYPGTTERVCLITGAVEGIMTVMDFIMDKIREKPDLTTKIIDAESKQTQERDKQVKILVPNSTAGMIIGKGGAYIKQIKEESGSYVQISQKPKDVSLQERCITIIGDKENNKNACKMILSKIVEDPQSGTCLNVSYADVSGPVANFNPTGSPYASNQNAINSSTASLNSTLGTAIGGAGSAAGLLVNGTGINLSLNLGAPNPAPNLAVATQLLEHIKVAMRGSGYSDTATNEVCAALGVLAKYGVLGMGVGVPHAANGAHTTLSSYLGVSALDQQNAAAASAASAGNVFGAVGQVNLEQYAAAAAAVAATQRPTQTHLEAAAAAAVQFDAFRHLSSATAPATTPVSLNNNSFGLTAATGTATTTQTLGASAHSLGGLSKSPTPGDLGAKDSKNVEIPEVIVGAILGPNGRSLVEIQHVSGANVQISKKGIFAPGTRNRIVTISGQPGAIAKAQFLIEQKINEEETKRARQIPLTTVVN